MLVCTCSVVCLLFVVLLYITWRWIEVKEVRSRAGLAEGCWCWHRAAIIVPVLVQVGGASTKRMIGHVRKLCVVFVSIVVSTRNAKTRVCVFAG